MGKKSQFLVQKRSEQGDNSPQPLDLSRRRSDWQNRRRVWTRRRQNSVVEILSSLSGSPDSDPPVEFAPGYEIASAEWLELCY